MIQNAPLFFIASCSGKEVNLSPKGYDTLRIIDDTTLIYLDYPGSGNRTARDLDEGGEATLMFCAFEGKPKILKLFCHGRVIGPKEPEFAQNAALFGENTDVIRQFIRFEAYAMESSCGMAVPEMNLLQPREALRVWAGKKAQNGTLETYIKEHEIPVELH